MRILYFWCEEDEGLTHEYNFVQEYRFAKKEAQRVGIQFSRPIPRDFFSYSRCSDISISAMIGANGSGKTTFARLLSSISKSGLKAILVVDDSDRGVDKVLVYSNLDVRFESANGVADDLIKKLNDAGNRRPMDSLQNAGWSFIYYSPLYSPQHTMESDGGFFKDLSTTYLMKNPVTQVAEPGENVQSWKRFEQEEANRVWEFIFEHAKESRRRKFMKGEYVDLPSIPALRGARILINERAIRVVERRFLEHLKGLEEGHSPSALLREPPRSRLRFGRDDYSDTPGGEFCKDVCAFIRRCQGVKNFFPRLVYAAALSRWHGQGAGLTNEPDGLDLTLLRLGDVLAMDNESELRHQLAALLGGVVEIREEDKSAWNYIWQGTLRLSRGVCRKAEEGLTIRFNSNEREHFLNLVYGYGIVKGKEDFLLFSEHPKVSSGEWAFITMMSRLFYSIRDSGRRFVIFMDEAETTLHPEYQRQLVKNMILFFEAFTPEVKIHVIFASHSPILLSDIPLGNVQFLGGGPKSTTNTFGSNIFDLYHIPFGMRDGAVGQFAADKIETVLSHIRKVADRNGERVVFSKDEKDVIELTGDMFLRDYFSRYMKPRG